MGVLALCNLLVENDAYRVEYGAALALAACFGVSRFLGIRKAFARGLSDEETSERPGPLGG